jgi:hypothetical protein
MMNLLHLYLNGKMVLHTKYFHINFISQLSVIKPSSGNDNRQEYSIDILVIYQNETFELVFVCEKNIPQKV